jgi:hypothetical protein
MRWLKIWAKRFGGSKFTQPSPERPVMKILKNKQWVFAFVVISSLTVFMPGKVFANSLSANPGEWLNYTQLYPNNLCSATVAFANKSIYIQRCIRDPNRTPKGQSYMFTYIYNHSAIGNYIGVDDYELVKSSWYEPGLGHGACPLRYFAPYQKLMCFVAFFDDGIVDYPMIGFSRVWLRGPKISPQNYSWSNSDGYTPVSRMVNWHYTSP